MNDRIIVAEYGDVAQRKFGLSAKEVDAVVRALNESNSPVLVLEDWIVEEKDLQPIDGMWTVYQVGIGRSTDKAWRAIQGETGEWVPKSCSVVFTRANGVMEIQTPTKTLDEFGGESA